MLSKVLPDIGITDSGVRYYPATDQKSISGIEAVESEQSGHSHSQPSLYSDMGGTDWSLFENV